MPVITFGTLADDPLGIASTTAEGINGLGQIVGSYTTPSPAIHGFLYTAGDYTTIDDPLGTQGDFANGINGVGQIVGNYQTTVNGVSHGFLYNPYSSTPYTTLDDPLGTQGTFANGINGAGQIVGSYNDARGHTHGVHL
jgi:probable HAF family extracellular repeat protein